LTDRWLWLRGRAPRRGLRRARWARGRGDRSGGRRGVRNGDRRRGGLGQRARRRGGLAGLLDAARGGLGLSMWGLAHRLLTDICVALAERV
jgi:hypothetical protein